VWKRECFAELILSAAETCPEPSRRGLARL
jgi:hypothetical protein